MRTIEKTLFKFDELDDRAKDRARNWFREGVETEDLLDREDLGIVAEILGIKFDTRAVKLLGGGTRYESKIWYSGFSSQGDGASFEGRYSYAKGAAKAIRKYAPREEHLHRIADRLQELQCKNSYRLSATITQSGRYCHSGTMRVETCRGDDDAPHDVAEDMQDLMRAFADWVYSQLEAEYKYRMLEAEYEYRMSAECVDESIRSNEYVDESIRSNEYEFDETGKPA
jgi:hypothetical protein